jgi:AbiV family abortive infection protein
MAVTAQFILEGSEYALEQCGLLLRDANVLYRNGSYASAVVLTAFAREELGRSSSVPPRRDCNLIGQRSLAICRQSRSSYQAR